MHDGRYSILSEIKKKAVYLLCALSFLTAVFYNEFNLHKLPREYIQDGGTVITNDDASYLNPPKRFLQHKGWGEDYWGAKTGSFIRPPGYGLIYLPLLKIFGPEKSITALKYLHYFLFAFSVYWFYSILVMLIKNQKASILVTAFYGCSPFVIGFLSYTLTEAVSPSIMLLYVYLLFNAHNASSSRMKNKFYLLAALVFAFIFILRPVLGVFILFLPAFIITDYAELSIRIVSRKLLVYLSVAISLMAVWQIRNYRIAGKYVGLHPIYFEDNNSAYRAPFRAYWDFAGCWAERGDKGFSYMMPMWEAAIKGDTSFSYIENAIDSLPGHVTSFFGRTRLEAAFRNYQSAVTYQKYYYDRKLRMPMQAALVEKDAENNFRALAAEYKRGFPFQYYIRSPLKVFGTLTFHSNLSLYVFQQTYRGAWWMEALRLICFSIHGLCSLFVFVNMLRIKKHRLLSLVFGWIPFAYIFYLCFVQRGVEERYTLPILPLLLIGFVSSIWFLRNELLRIRNTR